MRKTLVSSLVFLLISIGSTGTAEAQLASPQCDACRKACINARESCKVYACLTSGGQPGPSSCQGPNARYVGAVSSNLTAKDITEFRSSSSQQSSLRP
jgi:hypothetical protein